MATSRRRGFVLAAVVAGSVLVLSATAWACIGLSTLSAGSSSPAPGQQLEVRGEGYASNGGKVSVHLDSPKGEVVAMVAPENDGTFRTTFTVPNLHGQHVLVAVQRDARDSITKTANLLIEVPDSASLVGNSAHGDVGPVAPTSGPPGFAAGAALGLTALVLIAGTVTLLARRRRSGPLRPLHA